MAKVSIAIDEQDLVWLRKRAARLRRGNLSAAIAEATNLLRNDDALTALLDDLGAPALSPARLAALGAELDGRPLRRAAAM